MRKMAAVAEQRRGGNGAAVLRQGFAKLYGGGGGVGEGEGGTKGKGKRSSIPPLRDSSVKRLRVEAPKTF